MNTRPWWMRRDYFRGRGGIVDIWLPSRTNPVRIELVGDEIETLREFDPATQRSGQRNRHPLDYTRK